MKRRNEIDICADVLRIAKGGAKKTRIVYAGNLNFKIVKRYLSRLMEPGLLVLRDEIYCTTDMGVRFLEVYGGLNSMLEGDFLAIDQMGGGVKIVREG